MRFWLLIVLVMGSLAYGVGQDTLLAKKPSLYQRPRPNPSVQSLAYNLSGLWVGELLQNEGGIAEKFEFSMQLRQNGIFMNGTAFVRLGEIWAEMKLSGYQQTNGSWRLTETDVLRFKKPDELSWCMKHYELRVEYTATGIRLHGPWWGNSEFGPCIPGSVRLKIRKKSA